jgi:Putative zinc-finger
MNRSCPSWRGEIGAYIVGALDPEAVARVRHHLRRCQACRDDYADLVPVRGCLGWLATADGVPAGPGTLPYPPLEPLRPLRNWWRRRWVVSGAAAVCLAAAIVLAVQLSLSPVAPVFSAFDRATGVHGEAQLQAMATGTQIDLSVSGLPAGEHCTLVAVSRAGTTPAGTWTATYDGTAHITGVSAIPAGQLLTLRIETPADQVLLSIRV